MEKASVLRETYSRRHKRLKSSNDGESCGNAVFSTSACNESLIRTPDYPIVVDYSDPYAISDMLYELDSGKYGSVTKDIKELEDLMMQVWAPRLAANPELQALFFKGKNSSTAFSSCEHKPLRDSIQNRDAPISSPIIIESDEEEDKCDVPSITFHQVSLPKFPEKLPPVVSVQEKSKPKTEHVETSITKEFKTDVGFDRGTKTEVEFSKEAKTEVGFAKEAKMESDEDESTVSDDEDIETKKKDDGLGDIWNEMSFALESSKDASEFSFHEEEEQDGEEYCDHSFVLKDDLGYVCRICGVVQRAIETIIEVQFGKAKKSMRTYMYESRSSKERDPHESMGMDLSKEELRAGEIHAHPRHLKQMKPHQVEGFNFLCSNLVGENPGGCILAHAPGSGKTFMIISFMQSFLARYPEARPLVILPKGILPVWKKEFQTWQIEDIPLYDFYAVKADSRAQQLEVLKQWLEQKSILFLGYKQFTSIVCDNGTGKVSSACQEILLKRPSILILDEGHTPRNEDTDVLQSLAKVQTSRKVVLSGTLYQNHVKEVFNILNLVRPKFLRLDYARRITKRILSKAYIPGAKRHVKLGSEAAFYDLVEHTIQKDSDFRRKIAVIQDLREMTSRVLHYYKGDFLDELPGLVDFTVVLNLTPRQRQEVENLKKVVRKFKRSSVGSAVYLHPKLNAFSENSSVTDPMMDELLAKLDVKDGVKGKFFLNLVSLCHSAGEKLLVFSQYLTPLKFLERLVTKMKGWVLGREIFVISGESSSEQRELAMERFNNSGEARVFFGSIKACGEGISLVGSSRVLILDVHLNPSVTRQAIGRAFRPGQTKKVYAYRLVAADSPEEEDHGACFRKEAIAKMWFEWNEFCGFQNFEVETVDLEGCGDPFLESPLLKEDIKVLYKR